MHDITRITSYTCASLEEFGIAGTGFIKQLNTEVSDCKTPTSSEGCGDTVPGTSFNSTGSAFKF